MQKVLLAMQRKILAQSLRSALQASGKFEVYLEACNKNVLLAALKFGANIILIEIPESGVEPAKEKLNLCREIRKAIPESKLFMLCPEYSEESKNLVVDAKKHGEIEDFIFYDTSLEYFVKKLESMC